ncbi:MAG: hypothetical protein ACRD0A_08120 [Acidimicrobiales bacterium]
MSGEVAPVMMAAEDAVELGEMLEFLHHWIDDAPDALAEGLGRFTGGGFGIDELAAALARFAFLLGGDGERFVYGGER